MNHPKRLNLKKRLTRDLSLWALFAIDSECLVHGAQAPLPLKSWRHSVSTPSERLNEQIEAWRNDLSIQKVCFSHIRNKANLKRIWGDHKFWQKITDEMNELLLYQSSIDILISRCALRWKLNRMGSIDRSVLRLGTYELYFSDLPAKAILNEAVELGKRYGSNDSSRFINGVLDRVAQELGRIEKRSNNDIVVSVVHRKN